MTLIVEPAGVDSNSYLSIEDADALAGDDLGTLAKDWLTATSDKKEAALKRATRDVEKFVTATGYTFDRYTDSVYLGIRQSLIFPRVGDLDTVGVPIIIPSVREATYRQAVYVLHNADTIDAAAGRRARGMANWSEPNVSGQLASDPTEGRYAPELRSILGDTVGGTVVGWIQPY